MALQDEAYGPYVQYLREMGLGAGGYQNPAQRYLARMYEPLRSLYETQQPIGLAAGVPMPPWSFAPGQPGFASSESLQSQGMGQVRQQGSDILGRLMGITPGRRQEMGLTYEPTFDPLTGTASYEGGQNLGNLQDLMQLGMAQKFGPIGANWAANRLPYMQQQWMLEQAGGPARQSQAGTFLDYIRRKYGI